MSSLDFWHVHCYQNASTSGRYSCVTYELHLAVAITQKYVFIRENREPVGTTNSAESDTTTGIKSEDKLMKKTTIAAAKKAAKKAVKKAAVKKVAATKAPAKKAAAKKTVAPKAPAKKVAAPKAPAKKAAAAKAPAKKVAKKAAPKTSIVANVDIGFGNTLFLRGSAKGLSWSEGVPMDCKSDSSWSIDIAGVTSAFEFKVLINDEYWSAGYNDVAEPGVETTISPAF